MNILFVTYGELSFGGRNARSVSILYALADAGHQVDVIASAAAGLSHPHIRIVAGTTDPRISKRTLRMRVLKTVGRVAYDAVHGVDDAVVFVSRICRLRKIPFIYEASRCFTGSAGSAPSRWWNFFPGHYWKSERKILRQAAGILTPCSNLSSDIKTLEAGARVLQIEDVPLQSFFPKKEVERRSLTKRFDGPSTAIAVCSVLPGNNRDIQKLLISIRKVLDVLPHVAFFFKGIPAGDAEAVAAKLDIQKRCCFLTPDETELFLCALDYADAALFVPHSGTRYVYPDLFTLLHSPAPLVAIEDRVYEHILNEKNSVRVIFDADSIAEGMLRVIQEPLFSIGIATEGQQLIADKFSHSSFKHKIRMAYHDMLTKG